MSRKVYYIGMIAKDAPNGQIVASCPTDHETLVQMRKDGLECHYIDVGHCVIAMMHNADSVDPILCSMAIDAFLYFVENGVPMVTTSL